MSKNIVCALRFPQLLANKHHRLCDAKFGRKVIWDQLLDTKAEIIQSKLYFRFACIMPELNLERLTEGHNKGFWLHSLQSVNEHHNCVIQSNIPFESKALIKPDENIFYTQ